MDHFGSLRRLARITPNDAVKVIMSDNPRRTPEIPEPPPQELPPRDPNPAPIVDPPPTEVPPRPPTKERTQARRQDRPPRGGTSSSVWCAVCCA
jgi:hypothetical protein